MIGKLIYISNTRIPSLKANTYQSFCVCEAFAQQSLAVEFWHPARHRDYASDAGRIDLDQIFRRFDVPQLFTLKRLPCLDLPFLARSLPKVWSLLGAFTFSLSSLVRLRGERADAVVYTRDSISLSLLAWGKRLGLVKQMVFYEAHRYSLREQRHQRFIDGIVTVNNHLRTLYDPSGTGNVVTAHDAIRLGTFAGESPAADAAVITRHGLHQKATFVSYIGRFTAMGTDKGVRTILKSAAYLSHLDLTFLFVGGPMAAVEEFRALMQQEGIDAERAVFLDHQPVQELKGFYSISTLLLMPYPFTTHHAYYLSPLKMFEYMTSKRPIVASRLPSLCEVLHDGVNAILCEPDDPRDLAAKIEWALSHDCTPLAERAWQDVQDRTWEKRARHILGFMMQSGAFANKGGCACTDAGEQGETLTDE